MPTGPMTPLRQIRIAAGLSLREVERRTGINRGRLSIIERGVSPTEDESRAILAALQVTVVPPEPKEEDVA
jgi:transcriptional regulator with XRE-family HTH domain